MWYKCVISFCFLGCFWLTPSSMQVSPSSGQASQFHPLSHAVLIERQQHAMAKASPPKTGNRWNMSRWKQAPPGGISLAQSLGIKKGVIHFRPLQARLPGKVSESQSRAGSGASGGGSGLPKGGQPAANAALGQRLAAQRGWTGAQWTALNNIAMAESGWQVNATNPSSGAYGIPQALPGSKMASAGSDWQTNAGTQIKWMLDYIRSRYGTPERAWQFHLANGWY